MTKWSHVKVWQTPERGTDFASNPRGGPNVNTRTIAIIALIIAVIVLIILLT